ncbi:MAG: type I-E CRISPR-associated protein Cse1/CasA [Sphaerochaetaceae bacterium]
MKEYNLVTEKWIPIRNHERVSLADIFVDKSLKELGGNPLEHIAVTKFLLAICQDAYTPQDNREYLAYDENQLCSEVSAYLDNNSEFFNLYDEKQPFLQFPALIKSEKVLAYEKGFPEIPSENGTILYQSQVLVNVRNAQRAMMLIVNQGFAFGGKKTDSKTTLDKELVRKSASCGPLQGNSYLHAYIEGDTVLQTLKLNILTVEEIQRHHFLSEGVGIAPWRQMPTTEKDSIAEKYIHSYMSQLIPMNRYLLFLEDDYRLIEGISYPPLSTQWYPFSVSVAQLDFDKPIVIHANPTKKPWRSLPAMLSFMNEDSQKEKYGNEQLSFGLSKVKELKLSHYHIYAGGVNTSNTAGEHTVGNGCDFVQSRFDLNVKDSEEFWFLYYEKAIGIFEQCSNILWGAIRNFYVELGYSNVAKAKASSGQASFWDQAESLAKLLICACQDSDTNALNNIYNTIISYCANIYSEFCENSTPRQFVSWVKNQPNFKKIFEEMKE